MRPEQVKQYLEFYRDLGIDILYRRDPIVVADSEQFADPTNAEIVTEPAPRAEVTVLPGISPGDDTLDTIRLDIGDCTRCRLSQGRTNIVFGSGNEQAKVVFVGEGPGADEDEQGLPFVGRAGQLLTQMIDNTAAKVYKQKAEATGCKVYWGR